MKRTLRHLAGFALDLACLAVGVWLANRTLDKWDRKEKKHG